jgi:hypothetical protein
VSGGRGGQEIKRGKALDKLKATVEGLAQDWVDYAQDAGQAVMQSKEFGEPVAELFGDVKDAKEAGRVAALKLFDEVTGYQAESSS